MLILHLPLLHPSLGLSLCVISLVIHIHTLMTRNNHKTEICAVCSQVCYTRCLSKEYSSGLGCAEEADVERTDRALARLNAQTRSLKINGAWKHGAIGCMSKDRKSEDDACCEAFGKYAKNGRTEISIDRTPQAGGRPTRTVRKGPKGRKDVAVAAVLSHRHFLRPASWDGMLLRHVMDG